MSLPVLVAVQVAGEKKQMLLKAPRLEEGIDSNALKNRTSSKIS